MGGGGSPAEKGSSESETTHDQQNVVGVSTSENQPLLQVRLDEAGGFFPEGDAEEAVVVPVVDGVPVVEGRKHVSYEIELVVESSWAPDVVGTPLLESLPFRMMKLTKFNGVCLTTILDDAVIRAGDVLTIEATATQFVKLRQQFLAGVLTPASPTYPLLGRGRKGRSLYQVSAASSEVFEGLVGSSSCTGAGGANNTTVYQAQAQFFNDAEGVVVGYDRKYNVLLVEGGPDFLVDAGKTNKFPLITIVPGSKTPRVDSYTDSIRGGIVFVVFFAVILMHSGLFGATKDHYLFTVHLYCVALLAVFLKVLTWKMALSAIHPGPVLTYAAAGVIKNAISKNSGLNHVLGNWVGGSCCTLWSHRRCCPTDVLSGPSWTSL